MPHQMALLVQCKSVLAVLCRRACLAKFLAFWLHALEIAAAFEELADTCWSKLLNRQSQVCSRWYAGCSWA